MIYIDNGISRIRKLHQDTLSLDIRKTSISRFLSLQAQTLLEAHSSGNTAVVFHFACWCQSLISQSEAKIMSTVIDLKMARQTIAAEYGFTGWDMIEKLEETGFDAAFEQCVDCMLKGDIDDLNLRLTEHPALAQQRSQFGHRATLLHYIAANGVESHRQVTPYSASEITQCLFDHGADADAIANIYGGSNTMQLLLSSAHPSNAGVTEAVARVLNLYSKK